jgi:signal transduction histidine kinase
LFDLNQEVASLKEQLIFSRGQLTDGQWVRENLGQKRLMIVGEGLVFLFLLSLGIIQTRRSFKKETNLARQQNNFLLSITHELKSPLASIKLFIQTLEKRDIEKEKQKEMVKLALDEANRLDHLLENLLLTNRLDGEVFNVYPEKIDFTELIKETVARFSITHTSAVPFNLDLDESIYILADRTAIISVLENLMGNAIKYASESKFIHIELSREKDFALLRVIDQGSGIPDQLKKKVFEKFFRIENEETRRSKGAGLGLYIIKNLIVQQGGSIKVIDHNPKGAIFEVRLSLCVHEK